jgi:hypothetical protein
MMKNPIPLGENRGAEGKKVKSYGNVLRERFCPINPVEKIILRLSKFAQNTHFFPDWENISSKYKTGVFYC